MFSIDLLYCVSVNLKKTSLKFLEDKFFEKYKIQKKRFDMDKFMKIINEELNEIGVTDLSCFIDYDTEGNCYYHDEMLENIHIGVRLQELISGDCDPNYRSVSLTHIPISKLIKINKSAKSDYEESFKSMQYDLKIEDELEPCLVLSTDVSGY